MVSLEFMEKCQIFNGLNDDQLTAIQKYCEIKEFQRGDKIFAEGEEATHLCIVMEGDVDLRFDMPGHPTSEKNTISSVTGGGTFQWSGMVPPYKTRLSSYCTSRSCKIVQIDRKELFKLLEKDTKTGYLVMQNLAAIVGARFHRLQDEVANRRGFETMFSW